IKLFVENNSKLLVLALLFALASTVIFRQILPRLFVTNNTEPKLLFLLPLVRPLYALAEMIGGPMTPNLSAREKQKLEATVSPDTADERAEEAADEFQALMEVGEAEGIIEESEREMIETMVEFSDTRAGEIMTPRTEICALPITSTIRNARDLINEQKYSRIPVYRESIDNIAGILYVRDLLQAMTEG